MRRLRRISSAFLALVLLGAPRVHHAAELRVFCDGPLLLAMTALRDMFSNDTRHRVDVVFAASPVLHRRVIAGEPVDMLITQPARLDELVKVGKVAAAEQAVIGRIGIGLAVRASVAAPDISTAEGLKRALMDADSVAYTDLATGAYFGKLLERLGIAGEVKGKTSLYSSGAELFEHVLKDRGNDIGIGPVTTIISYGNQGLKPVGRLPAELQSHVVFKAAVMVGARSPEAAKEFIRFLLSAPAKVVFAATGVE